jgi:hypothetical protein
MDVAEPVLLAEPEESADAGHDAAQYSLQIMLLLLLSSKSFS